MTKNSLIIAFGFTQEEALSSARHLINIFQCAPENITVTTDPNLIYALRAEEKAVVGIKAHPTDQSQWSQLMPICRYMKAQNIKFQIIK